jgi:hypothetical protein
MDGSTGLRGMPPCYRGQKGAAAIRPRPTASLLCGPGVRSARGISEPDPVFFAIKPRPTRRGAAAWAAGADDVRRCGLCLRPLFLARPPGK